MSVLKELVPIKKRYILAYVGPFMTKAFCTGQCIGPSFAKSVTVIELKIILTLTKNKETNVRNCYERLSMRTINLAILTDNIIISFGKLLSHYVQIRCG